jgi:hypothetical protein
LFEQIDRLSETADERGQAMLGEWCDYAEMIAPELAWCRLGSGVQYPGTS